MWNKRIVNVFVNKNWFDHSEEAKMNMLRTARLFICVANRKVVLKAQAQPEFPTFATCTILESMKHNLIEYQFNAKVLYGA